MTSPKIVANATSAASRPNESHGNTGAGGVEDVPAVLEEYFDVGMEVRRPQGRICAVIRPGGDTRRDVERAAQRDHQVSEVAADPHTLNECVDGRRVRVRRVGGKGDVLLHPVLDGQHPVVAWPKITELLEGKLQQSVRLAVSTGVHIREHLKRQGSHRHFKQSLRLGKMVVYLDERAIRDVQRPRGCVQPREDTRRIWMDRRFKLHAWLTMSCSSLPF